MNLEDYKYVQSLAKSVHSELGEHIAADSTERDIAKKCVELLLQKGIRDTWYHNVPAFVLLGSRSCLSVSGRDYQPATELVGKQNVITVDLSPSLNGIWGDCARTFCVEDGQYSPQPSNTQFAAGLAAEAELHQAMRSFVLPDTSFSDLFQFGNEQITSMGYENLDFLGNLGHSIETDPAKRRYIDAGCKTLLGDVSYFTFEPHIRRIGYDWGFKHENIYYFDLDRKLQEL